MKKTKNKLYFLALLTIFACKKTTEKTEEIIYNEKKNDQCIAPSSWFELVNNSRKTPAPNEGTLSVFSDNKTVSNCDFHQWSWQKFLWLTNEENGQPYFIKHLIQISSIGKRLETNNEIILTDTAQASSSSDILKTPVLPSGTPPSTTVYYSIFMNKLMYATILKYGPIAKKDPLKIKEITFPVGALELKTSWIKATALKDTSNYFVTDGLIEGVKTKVALLGMHVVGVVENHPEFIWATFEHDNLAPSYDWSKATPTTDIAVTTEVDYPFFSKNAIATIKNITSNNGLYTNIFSVYKYGVPIQKETKGTHNVQVFMKTSQPGSVNFNNIRTINESVKKQLKGIWNNYFYNGSIWIDTEGYIGNRSQANLINTLGSDLSNSSPGKQTRGSVAAYNITMETYVQLGFGTPTSIHGNTVDNLVNCFSCHNSNHIYNKTSKQVVTSPLNISHIFTAYVQNLNGLSKKEIKQNHVDEIIRQYKLRLSSN